MSTILFNMTPSQKALLIAALLDCQPCTAVKALKSEGASLRNNFLRTRFLKTLAKMDLIEATLCEIMGE